MKKLLTLFAMCFAFIAFSTSSNAQEKNHPGTYSLTIDPFDFLVSKTLDVTFEYKLSPKNSFTISGLYIPYNDRWSGFGLGVSYRWYFDLFKEGKKSLNGFSFGPMARASWWSDDLKIHDDETFFSIGGEVAYKWVFSGGWTVEPIIRLSFGVSEISGLGYEPIGAGINVGYTW